MSALLGPHTWSQPKPQKQLNLRILNNLINFNPLFISTYLLCNLDFGKLQLLKSFLGIECVWKKTTKESIQHSSQGSKISHAREKWFIEIVWKMSHFKGNGNWYHPLKRLIACLSLIGLKLVKIRANFKTNKRKLSATNTSKIHVLDELQSFVISFFLFNF